MSKSATSGLKFSSQLGLMNKDSLLFPAYQWLLSRMVILVAMLLIAPLLPMPPGGIQAHFGWEVFSAWDSTFYEKIASSGYEILENQQPGANVAFFPLFPVAIYLFSKLGISTAIAGTLLNHLAFLGTLVLVYDWVKSSNSIEAARWTTAVLAWCPLSLFCSVVYSEGLFLLFSTAALRAFDRQSFWRSALWGSFATASRVTGLAIIPALLLTAFFRKYPLSAYLASLSTATGVMVYGIYCWFTFGDPLAFITVQYSQWDRSRGLDGAEWSRMIVEIVAGGSNWNAGELKDITHPLIFGIICLLGWLLWKFKEKIGSKFVDYGYFFLFVVLWILVGDPLLNTVSVLGSIYLLWKLRKDLSLVVVNYGFCGLGMLIASGGTSSLNRYVYGIISASIALGFLLSRHPRWGFNVMGFFGLLLILMSVRFAQHLWVA
jgi:Gpi18-like mannosyltransferase